MAKLTTETVRKTKPKAKEFFIWDARLPGFGLRVKPNGTKSFVIQYRDLHGRSKRATLGQFGKPLTADEAFKAARERLAKVALGADPIGEAKSRRRSPTIKEFCETYLRDAQAGRVLTRRRMPKSASTLATDKGRINAHIVPLLGSKLVSELTRSDIKTFLKEVADGKTARNQKSRALRGRTIVTGGIGTAKRTVGLLQGILTYAIDEGIIETNPALGLRLVADNRREFTDPHETYAALGNALRCARRDGEHWQAIALIQFIAVTGLRRGEAVGLKWREVNMNSLTLDLDETKTGKSRRPISATATRILDEIRRTRNNSTFVFPGIRSEQAHYGALPNAWKRICTSKGLTDEELRLLARISPHNLRHGFATIGNSLGITETTIGAILGHQNRGITEAYITHTLNDLLARSEDIAQEISDLMDGKEERPPEWVSSKHDGNILPFRT